MLNIQHSIQKREPAAENRIGENEITKQVGDVVFCPLPQSKIHHRQSKMSRGGGGNGAGGSRATAKFFGQSRTLEARLFARIVQSALSLKLLLTRW
jgi:hypothetical protein